MIRDLPRPRSQTWGFAACRPRLNAQIERTITENADAPLTPSKVQPFTLLLLDSFLDSNQLCIGIGLFELACRIRRDMTPVQSPSFLNQGAATHRDTSDVRNPRQRYTSPGRGSPASFLCPELKASRRGPRHRRWKASQPSNDHR